MALYPDVILADGPSHYWRLNETPGTTVADLAGGLTGTISGGVTGTPGALAEGDSALAFNGSTGKIVMSAPLAVSGPFTWEAWIRFDSGEAGIFGTRASPATGDRVAATLSSANYLTFLCAYANGAAAPTSHTANLATALAKAVLGDWHHVVWTLGTAIHCYVDGVEEALDVPLTIPVVGMNAVLELGWSPLHGSWFPGALDELAIYPKVLTPAQVSAHYAARLLTPPPPMAGAPSVIIATVDQTLSTRAYSLRYEYQLGARGRAEFEIVDQDSTQTAYRPQIDARVELRQGATILFRGKILSLTDKPLGDPGVGTVTAVTAIDDWAVASLRRVNKSYLAGLTLKAIVDDLVATYLAVYGLTVGAWPPSNPTGPTLPAITWDGVTVEDAFNQLVDLSGNWVYRLNPTGQILWFGPGHRVEGTVFSAANRNILGPLTWTKTRVQHANRVLVRYGTGLVGTGQTFTGNGTQIRFPLSFPVAQVGHLTYEGAPYPPGKSGIELVGLDAATPRPWYVDLATQELVRNIGKGIPGGVAAPPASGHIIRFYYNVQYPLTVSAAAPEAATFPIDAILERGDIFNTAQAQALAQTQLDKLTALPRLLTLATRLPGTEQILPGDSLKVDVPERILPLSAAPLGWLIVESRVIFDVDQNATTTFTLLEPTGGPLVLSWINFWRDIAGTGAGVGIASGSVMAPPHTPTSPPPGEIGAGMWTPIPYAAGNFTGAGGLIWTVEAGDVYSLAYTRIGATAIVNINILQAVLSGTASQTLYCKIPFPATGNSQAVGRYSTPTAYNPMLLYTVAGESYVALTPLANASFVLGSGFLTQGTIVFAAA